MHKSSSIFIDTPLDTNAGDKHTCLFDSLYMAHTQMHLVYPLDLPNSSNHTELLTFSCVRSTVEVKVARC